MPLTLIKINRVRPTDIFNIYMKFEMRRMHRLDAIMFTHVHTYKHTEIHTYIHRRKKI